MTKTRLTMGQKKEKKESMENENKKGFDDFKKARKIICANDGSVASIRNAVESIHDVVEFLLEDLDPHFLLHGQNVNFMTAGYLHQIAKSLSILIDEDVE